MRLLLFTLFFSTTLAYSQKEILLEVTNVPASIGKINVAVYNTEDSFLKFDGVYASKSVSAVKGTTNLVLENLPDGEYAVALYYDENDNSKLDTNWIGIPKEKVAFSKGKMKTFGPPKFKECAFWLESDMTLQISL